MSDHATLLQDLSALLDQHNVAPKRGAQLQSACTHVWGLMETDPTIAKRYLDDFIKLLQTDTNLLLARLVIPELRSPTQQSNVLRQEALRRINPLRLRQTRDNHAQPFFAQEAIVLRDARMHRMNILVHNRASFSGSQREELQKWLDACPIPCSF